jgi:hypothetical protein
MFFELLLAALLLAPTVSQTQKSQAPVTPQQTPPAVNAPPINMGLWDSTMSIGTSGATYKSRACLSQESYQRMLTRVPPNCTVSNLTATPTSLTGDVSCESPSGGKSKGHVDVQIPDSSTVHGTITVTTSYQGHSMTMAIKSDAHFVSADCGDLSPGESRDVQ